MSVRISVVLRLGILGCIALFSTANAGSHSTINLNEINSQKSSFVWQPTSNGLARYQLVIPNKGIQEAIRYGDTSSLFYMSARTDKGISLVRENTGHVNISTHQKTYKVVYSKAVSEGLTYKIGGQVIRDEATPVFGLRYRNVIGNQSLDEFNAFYYSDNLDLLWSRSILSDMEDVETFWTFAKQRDQLSAGWGYRWFDVVDGYDVLAEASLSGKSAAIAAQFDAKIGVLNAYFGGKFDFSHKEAALLLGGTWDLKRELSLSISNSVTMLSANAQSLKSVRRDMLPSYWRSYVKY